MRSTIILNAVSLCGIAAPAWAHHEAIYGSQSALVLAGERDVTMQVFSRQTGPKDERVQETTTVLSGGLSLPRVPVSLSIVVPFSVIAEGNTADGRVLSQQFGVSRAVVSRETVQGLVMNDTGGWAVVAHPTITWSTNERLLIFASTSVPLAHHWRNPADEERFRIGAGAILALGR